MSDQPTVDELKAHEQGDAIPVEETVEPSADKQPEGAFDVRAELSQLGRQVAETLRSAWSSEERQRLEHEIREGVQSFVREAEEVIREVREGSTGQKLRTEAVNLKDQVETAELGRKVRSGIVQGLRWLSDEMGKLADQFTPHEKEAPAAGSDGEDKTA